MDDDASTQDDPPPSPPPSPADEDAAPLPVCAHCFLEDVAISIEYVEDPHPDHGSVELVDLCLCCTASVLLTMPHCCSMVQHPMALRKYSMPVSRPRSLEHDPEPETFRPLKKIRLAEHEEDKSCDLCHRCALAVSLDLVTKSDGVRLDGEFCYRCGAKYLIEIAAGVYSFNELNDTALLFICWGLKKLLVIFFLS